MLPRNLLDWIGQNRLLAGGLALSLIVGAAGVTLVLTGDEDAASRLADRGPAAEASDRVPGSGDDPLALDASGDGTDGDGADGADGGGRSSATVGGGREGGGGEPILPGTKSAPPCEPKAVDETGVSDDEIVIGQIVTDVNELPQQLRPAYEGLKSYVDLVNRKGGVCGRKLRLEYRNDQLNPAVHTNDYQSLARQVFAFVANESLLESQDYQSEPPFEPRWTDDGEPVPDVGGLAFSYGRSQSKWHAGVVGSISPTLVSGAQFTYFADRAEAKGKPCRKGAIVYVDEPTGASQEQARVGRVSVEEDWGAGLGKGNTQLYSTRLADPVPVYETTVDQMIEDGMNCVFSYLDLGSNVNLVRAMTNRGVWPPHKCQRGDECFRVTYVTLSTYDPKFIQDAGEGAIGVSTYIPHVPLNEMESAGMRVYLEALESSFPESRPSTFSILGFASGQMFVEALQACGGAPTRPCVMRVLREMENFTSGGILGGTTPFRTTRVNYASYGTYDWKWIFHCTIALEVTERAGKRDFRRTNPPKDFLCDTMHVARGTEA